MGSRLVDGSGLNSYHISHPFDDHRIGNLLHRLVFFLFLLRRCPTRLREWNYSGEMKKNYRTFEKVRLFIYMLMNVGFALWIIVFIRERSVHGLVFTSNEEKWSNIDFKSSLLGRIRFLRATPSKQRWILNWRLFRHLLFHTLFQILIVERIFPSTL